MKSIRFRACDLRNRGRLDFRAALDNGVTLAFIRIGVHANRKMDFVALLR